MLISARERMAQNCVNIAKVLDRTTPDNRGPLDWLELARLYNEKSEIYREAFYADSSGADHYQVCADYAIERAMKIIGI